jgi:hypothetical protein
VRGSGLHPTDQQIEWAQADSAREVLDGRVWFAEISPRPAAVRRCQIWVERESLIDEGGAIVKVADNKGERSPAGGEPLSIGRRPSARLRRTPRPRPRLPLDRMVDKMLARRRPHGIAIMRPPGVDNAEQCKMSFVSGISITISIVMSGNWQYLILPWRRQVSNKFGN